MKECVTHHHACECREEKFKALLEAAEKYVGLSSTTNFENLKAAITQAKELWP